MTAAMVGHLQISCSASTVSSSSECDGPPADSGLSMARVNRKTDSEAESADWVARLRRFHAHQPGPAGSAVELLRELRDQEPCVRQRFTPCFAKACPQTHPGWMDERPT